MDLHEAWAALGIEPPANDAQVRTAYRRLLRSRHPDLCGDTDATLRTIELTRAYAMVQAAQRHRALSGRESLNATDGTVPVDEHPVTPASSLAVTKIADDAIGISAPRGRAFRFLVDAVTSLGEITYLDGGSGLIEIVVDFEQHGTCQIVFALGDSSGVVTQLSLTVESYHPHPPPTIAEVTRMVVEALSGGT